MVATKLEFEYQIRYDTTKMFWSQSEVPSAISPDHGYILLAVVGTWFVHNGWMASKVMKARKQYQIKYPTLYCSGDGENEKMYVSISDGQNRSWDPGICAWLGSHLGSHLESHLESYLTCPCAGRSFYRFNCVQRGHQNSLEGLAGFLALLLSAGVFYPKASAIAAFVYNVGAIRYMRGYATGDPKNRMRGSIKYLGLLYLLGANVRAAVQLLFDV